MRDEYIKYIKEYILAKPDYKSAIQELKTNILSVGATEEELKEALRQLDVPPDLVGALAESKNEKTSKKDFKKSFLFKHLVEIDIATHVAFAIIGVFLICIFLFTPTLSKLISTFQQSNKDNKIVTQSPVKPISSNDLTPQVYANTQKLNSARIFSFPPSKVTLAVNGTPKKEVVGFFPYWMLDNADQVSLNALTTVALFGLEVDGKGNIITGSSDGEVDGGWSMWNNPNLDTFIKRAKQKRLKVVLTMKAFDNGHIEQLVQSDTAQRTFISNAIQLVNLKSLNGINLDFEYVGTPSQKVIDGFTRLVTNLATELKRQVSNSTVTVDAYINSAAIPRLLDVIPLTSQIDGLIIMGYDIHTPLGSPGPVAPMEGELSIIGYMESFLEKVPPEKLILSVPYYGYDWPVPNVQGGDVRTIPYAELAATSSEDTIKWDDTSQTPWYQYIDPETRVLREVHFENARSLGIKYDYVNRKNLQGIAIWALGYDGLNADLRSTIIEKFAN